MADKHVVSALFRNRAEAEHAIERLTRAGVQRSDIGLVMSDETRRREFKDGTKAGEGAGVGGGIGLGAGAIIAGIAAIGTTLAIPGLGIIVAGPVAAALAGAGAGAAIGGVIGALVGAGIPEKRARVYERGIREGGMVLTVQARDLVEARRLQDELEGEGGRDVHDQPHA